MIILVQPAQLQQQQHQRQSGGRPAAGGAQGALMQRNADGSLVNPAAAIQAFKADRVMMDTFRAQAPRLYDAIMSDDVTALQEELRRAHRWGGWGPPPYEAKGCRLRWDGVQGVRSKGRLCWLLSWRGGGLAGFKGPAP
jgi:hypothetical protein